MLQERFMRLPDVEGQVGFRRSKIYAMIQEKQFPAPIKLGRTSVWLQTEVAAWMTERIDAARVSPVATGQSDFGMDSAAQRLTRRPCSVAPRSPRR